MTAYIVAYDLNQETRRPNIVAEVKAHPLLGASQRVFYAIDTAETVTQVLQCFRPYLDQNDQLYVIKLTAPWNGHGPNDVNSWLRQRLGPAG
jgi:hypothetical protein